MTTNSTDPSGDAPGAGGEPLCRALSEAALPGGRQGVELRKTDSPSVAELLARRPAQFFYPDEVWRSDTAAPTETDSGDEEAQGLRLQQLGED